MPWLGPNRQITRAPAWLRAMTPKTWTTVAPAASACDPNADASANVVNWPSNGTWTATQSVRCRSRPGDGRMERRSGRRHAARHGRERRHGDYYGNEVYALQLNAASPVWRRVSKPERHREPGGTGR